LYIAATTYGITRDAKRGFDKHRSEHAAYLRYMAGAPAIAALGKRVSALPSDQLVGSKWADLLVTVDVFIADWPRRMTVSADDPVETSEADLIASINKLDLWSDSIADLAVARGVTVHPHDDPMVRERLTSARQRASIKPKKG